MIPRSARLSRSVDTTRFMKYQGEFLRIRYQPSHIPTIGVVVSKKVSPKAHVRNRIRRIIQSLLFPRTTEMSVLCIALPTLSAIASHKWREVLQRDLAQWRKET